MEGANAEAEAKRQVRTADFIMVNGKSTLSPTQAHTHDCRILDLPSTSKIFHCNSNSTVGILRAYLWNSTCPDEAATKSTMMMKSAVLASLFASAAAFAPQPTARPSVATAAAVDEMPGAINFACNEFKFDPLKLSETYEPLLPWFRECELRHGRTAMLAVVGFIAEDFVRLPGEAYSFETIPKTIDAHDALLNMGAASPMGQLLLWIGLWDLIVTGPAALAAQNGDREAGGTYRESRKFSHLSRLWMARVEAGQRRKVQAKGQLRTAQWTSRHDCCRRNRHSVHHYWTRIPLRINRLPPKPKISLSY